MSEISGEFVRLRTLSESDAELTLRWRQGQRASLLNAGAETVEQQRAWISRRPASEINFIIELKGEPEEQSIPVGMLSLIAIDRDQGRAESARFLIGEEAAVRGIPAAVEAMKLLYELAFDQLGLRRIYGTIASENHLMIKWQKFLGMKEEGRLRQHYLINGKVQDAVCLGLLAEEYRKESLPRMKVLMAAGRR
jgi:RimJ/RimL family protein N-acetyltransferase